MRRSPDPSSPPRRRWAALALATLVAAAAIALVEWRHARLRHRWTARLGAQQAIVVRFAAPANATALALEREAARAGIELVPSGSDRARLPQSEQMDDGIADAIATYVHESIERAERSLEAPPAMVARALAARREPLERIVTILTTTKSPVWEHGLEPLGSPALPYLLGHVRLHRVLLADALAAAARGDRARADTRLAASGRLLDALRDTPHPICSLVAVSIARMHAGVVRQLGTEARPWLARIREHDWRADALVALEHDAWRLHATEPSAERVGVRLPALRPPLDVTARAAAALVDPLLAPYARFCLDDASGRYERAIAALARGDACVVPARPELAVTLPPWNRIDGDTGVPVDLAEVADRLARLALELELTELVLDAESAGRCPARRQSAACPTERWSCAANANGTLAIAYSGVVPPKPFGMHVPLRFALAQRSARVEPRRVASRQATSTASVPTLNAAVAP